jgi:hypothetical protein
MIVKEHIGSRLQYSTLGKDSRSSKGDSNGVRYTLGKEKNARQV